MTRSADNAIFLGAGAIPVSLPLKYANRHGLIAGATGTGKTITVQNLAEGFSRAGVPVFLADVKGDLAGLAMPGKISPGLAERAETVGLQDYAPAGYPVMFWDIFGEKGHPVRTTVSEMGPLLLSRLLNLNDAQEGVLSLAFRLADEEGMLLLDLKDLRALLVSIGERRRELQLEYGNVSGASIGAIQRRLLSLEDQGADRFFAEPALNLADFMQTAEDGRGYINILNAEKLMMAPRVYATFLLWMLSELFETLPESGDPDKPVLAFFFDEAHLLFDDCPEALLDRIEQVVRLIRSKGVGVYFATQNPMDIPDSVSSQLGNRIQHALRAYTPREQKVLKAAADSFRPNPAFESRIVIGELAVGEALVSTLMKKGVPSVVERTLIRPPASRMGTLTAAEYDAVMQESPAAGLYDTIVDRESAFEILAQRVEKETAEAARKQQKQSRADRKPRSRPRQSKSRIERAGDMVSRQIVRTLTARTINYILRGVLGGMRR